MQQIDLENEFLKVTILDVGATIYQFIVKSLNRNIVLSYEDLELYKSRDDGFFGSTIGRVSGRIKNSTVKIDNKKIILDIDNSIFLHGGKDGFSTREFKVTEKNSTKVKLQLNSFQDSNFPGIFSLTVIYSLSGKNLNLEYFATCTEKTPVSITNHSYFNLNGDETINNHILDFEFEKVQEWDKNLIPTGKNIIKKDSYFDTKGDKKLQTLLEQVKNFNNVGIDNYFYTNSKEIKLKVSDLELKINYSFPGTVLYSSNYPTFKKLTDKSSYTLHKAIAIEPSYPVDSLNNNIKPSTINPFEVFHESINYEVIC
ncbi:MAG: hypothetical protein LBV58_00830 [Acholeplasmatales bacterium]|jgi:aldose 1-epimerase|nr:hypothetical protein [Acholeplasmatales bacterium]